MSKKAWFFIIAFAVLAFAGGEVMVDSVVNENAVQRLANAIARAEGFFVSGSRPNRNNNPGDITKDFGFPTIGNDGIFPVFMTPNDGWEALKHLIRLMLTDRSSIYRSDMTIYEMATHYTETEQETWANNVADSLGVSVATPLNQIT